MDPDSIPRSIFTLAAAVGSTPAGTDIVRSVLLILLLILTGGFFSASETAYSNCSHVRLLSWAEDGRKSARRALTILDSFDKAIITLLIGTNVIHVLATSAATLLCVRLMNEVHGPIVATVVVTLLVFIFGEMIPKSIGKVRADSCACAFSGILAALMWLLTPVDWLFLSVGNGLKKLFHTEEEGPSMTEDDFQSIIESIEDEGVLEADESDLIQSAVEFTDRTVSEILTPRVHMIGLDLTDDDETNFDLIIQEKYSRLPVYEDNMDHIVGVLNTKQYLQAALQSPLKKASIREIMAEPYFITPSMGLHELVNEMRRRKNHLAVIQDEWGGTMGMVTLEDLLEELVGEIWDEDEEVKA